MNEFPKNPEGDEIEIDLGELFFFLLSKLGYIIAAAAACACIALAVTHFFITPTYTSTTKMYVLNRQNNDTVTQSDLQSSASLTNDYVVLIKSRSVVETVIADLALPMSYEGLLKELNVSTQSDTRVISISVTDADPYRARDIANAVREESATHIQQVMNTEAVNVVDEANVPMTKAGPNLKRNVLLAGLLGAVVMIAWFVIRYMLDDKVNVSEDVEKYLGLSVLGQLPVDENLQKTGKHKKNQKKRKKAKKSRSR